MRVAGWSPIGRKRASIEQRHVIRIYVMATDASSDTTKNTRLVGEGRSPPFQLVSTKMKRPSLKRNSPSTCSTVGDEGGGSISIDISKQAAAVSFGCRFFLSETVSWPGAAPDAGDSDTKRAVLETSAANYGDLFTEVAPPWALRRYDALLRTNVAPNDPV